VLHLSAAALALGAVVGLFVRGLAFEYRAGWESTFLEAPSVHALLAFFLSPAAHLLDQPFPTVEEIARLRWDAGSGENAARWIYLYTVAVAATAIVPRLVLAAVAGLRERMLSRRFPLPLDDAYFRRLLSGWRAAPARVEVMPYAYTAGEQAAQGLQRLAAALFGDDVEVHWLKGVAFGDEDVFGAKDSASTRARESLPQGAGAHSVSQGAGATSLQRGDGSSTLPSWQGGAGRAERGPDGPTTPDLVIALFNLAATPETENHGVFLDRLRARTPGALALIVDEGPYRTRLGTQAGAETRIAERRQAWSGLAQTRTMRPVFVDLTLPQLTAAQRELDALLIGRTAADRT
jgi:hypothetical protein